LLRFDPTAEIGENGHLRMGTSASFPMCI